MKRKNKIFQADLAAFKLMGYVLVFIWGMLCFLPFLLVVMNSFTAEANIMRNGYSFWPGEWTLEAYNTCLENPERIGFAYRNTIIATIVGTILSVLMSTMTGLVLAQKRFPVEKRLLFLLLLHDSVQRRPGSVVPDVHPLSGL